MRSSCAAAATSTSAWAFVATPPKSSKPTMMQAASFRRHSPNRGAASYGSSSCISSGRFAKGFVKAFRAVFVRCGGSVGLRACDAPTSSSKMALMLSVALSQAEAVGRSPRLPGRCLWFQSHRCVHAQPPKCTVGRARWRVAGCRGWLASCNILATCSHQPFLAHTSSRRPKGCDLHRCLQPWAVQTR